MNDENTLSAQLCQNSIFEGLTAEQIGGILPCIVYGVKKYGPEECIYNKGEPVHNLGVVLDGALTVCDENADGKRTTVANIERNELVGEGMIFSTSRSVPHRVIAHEDARVLFLNGEFFLSPCAKSCDKKQTHQEIIKNMLRLLSDKAILLGKKIAYLTAPDLKTKIAMYLCELYEVNCSCTFHMPLNRDRLAEFFAVARPSLSREFINLKNQNVIDFYRSSVQILDLNALYAIARGE